MLERMQAALQEDGKRFVAPLLYTHHTCRGGISQSTKIPPYAIVYHLWRARKAH